MSKNVRLLTLALGVLVGMDAYASYSDNARALIQLKIASPEAVIENTKDYEAKLDEVTTALYNGKNESARSVNALLKLQALKTQMIADFDVTNESSRKLLEYSGADVFKKTVERDMNTMILAVKASLADQRVKPAKRFDNANRAIMTAKTQFRQVRADIKKDMKKAGK